jgi:hypothetical protein
MIFLNIKNKMVSESPAKPVYLRITSMKYI